MSGNHANYGDLLTDRVRSRFPWVQDVPRIVGMLLRIHWPNTLAQLESPSGFKHAVHRCARIMNLPVPVTEAGSHESISVAPGNAQYSSAAEQGRSTATGAPPPEHIKCPWTCCHPDKSTSRTFPNAQSLWEHICEAHALQVPERVKLSQYGFFAARASHAASQMAPPHLSHIAARKAAEAAIEPERIRAATLTAQAANTDVNGESQVVRTPCATGTGLASAQPYAIQMNAASVTRASVAASHASTIASHASAIASSIANACSDARSASPVAIAAVSAADVEMSSFSAQDVRSLLNAIRSLQQARTGLEEMFRAGRKNWRARHEAAHLSTIDHPDEHVCPITLQVMKDPVVASDGHSYERRAIRRVLNTPNKRSPLTREVLREEVVPNHALRRRIEDHENDMDRIVAIAEAKCQETRQSVEAENALLRSQLEQLRAERAIDLSPSRSFDVGDAHTQKRRRCA